MSRASRGGARRRRASLAVVAVFAVLSSLLVAAPAQAAATPSLATATIPGARSGAELADAASSAAPRTALEGMLFHPGYIISDANFYDRYAMTETEIQVFLNTMIATTSAGSCQNSNCLAVTAVPTFRRAAETICGTYEGPANGAIQYETAARVIFKVQQACGISARVLLVTLQKEQSLLTTTAPTDSKMARAMGYACPDSANGACDALYAGLYNQLYWAGRQFVRYSNPPGTSNYFTWYPVGRPVAIQYHPNTACGASSVTIQNNATAALYYYTPYQPNAAALANLGRTGDACSSYGNRNFWYYYALWFGDPTVPRGSPYGVVESAVGVDGGIQVDGWAVIPESLGTKVNLAVEIAGTWTGLTADRPSATAEAEFPTAGPDHGFSALIPVAPGVRTFCLWASGLIMAKVLECRTVTVPVPIPPAGEITSLRGVQGGFEFSGWAVLPGSRSTPVHLAVNIGSTWLPFDANLPGATEAEAAYPGAGTDHAFSGFVPAPAGAQSFCLWALGSAGPSLLECRTVTVPVPLPPAGKITSVTTAPGAATLSGWAVQRSALTSTVALAVNVGSTWIGLDANLPGATAAETAYPGAGTNHGFQIAVPLPQGSHRLCLWATGPAGPVQLECVTATVPAPLPPAGRITSVTPDPTGVTLGGWAVQRSALTSTVALAVNVGSTWIGLDANLPGATEAETAYPGAGTNHGFQIRLVLPPGSHRLCLWATGPAGPVQLECVTAAVPVPLPPAGRITSVVADTTGVTLGGWAVQRSALTSTVALAVNVGSTWIGFDANRPGATAAEAAYPGAGTDHGFEVRVPLPPGTHRLCLWASGPTSAVQLECVTAVVPTVPPPAGAITALSGVAGGFEFSGWAVLPSSRTTAVHLAVNIGSTWLPFDANLPGATAAEIAYPGAGTNHGFSGFVAAPRGSQSFCLWAVGVAGPSILECRTVTVP